MDCFSTEISAEICHVVMLKMRHFYPATVNFIYNVDIRTLSERTDILTNIHIADVQMYGHRHTRTHTHTRTRLDALPGSIK